MLSLALVSSYKIMQHTPLLKYYTNVYRYAATIDSMLEDEEQFAEHLKEYYTFGDALRWIKYNH